MTVKKSQCLHEVAKSIQEMITLEQNRNSSNLAVHASPSLKKKQEPAVLEVNLREEYHKRKGTLPKPKLAKKTISIVPEAEKIGDSIGSIRKHSYSQQ